MLVENQPLTVRKIGGLVKSGLSALCFPGLDGSGFQAFITSFIPAFLFLRSIPPSSIDFRFVM
jgi:hypothetical protein